MPYNLEAAENLSRPHYGTKGLISLSEYVERGVGVCRHQCLLAAVILETLAENKIVAGKSGVERNHDLDANGAHAWATFETPGGQKFVLDPAQDFVGTKDKAHAEGRWKYYLPADR
jgi:transglutaminase-like putative cysteine protease